MTGCAFCGMKGFRVCDRCKARGEAIGAEIKAGMAAWAGEGVPKSSMVFGVDRSAVPFRFSPDYVSEPEPVELTVEDVLWALDTMMAREGLRLAGGGQVLGFGDDRAALFEAGGRHKFSGTLRDVLTEAKRRGLLG